MYNKKNVKEAFGMLKARDDLADVVLQKANTKNRAKRQTPRFAIIMAATLIVVLSLSAVAAISNWNFFANLLRDGFDDPISAEVVESGDLQELDVVHENDECTLKLTAFTGDKETQYVLFELTPKQGMPEFDTVKLTGRAVSPGVINADMLTKYGTDVVESYEVTHDSGTNTYYFKYKLPPFWVRNNDEDVVLHISGMAFFNGARLTTNVKCDMSFQFTPDREMLKDAIIVELHNQIMTKTVFENNFSLATGRSYEEFEVDEDTVIAPRFKGSVQIDEVIFSKYNTEIRCTIKDETITRKQASAIWDQFTEPWFVTDHYFDGVEKRNHYNGVAINNTRRIALYADGVEVPAIVESLTNWAPGKGHDENGELTEGEYGCSFQLEAVDYEKAESIEIRFGDVIIPVK